MRAKQVNEEMPVNPSNYIPEDNPHAAFNKARGIFLHEIKNLIKPELLASPDLLATDELMDVISTELTDGESFDDNSWKNIFDENYLGPIIDALEVIQRKVQELELLEGVGDLDYGKRKKSSLTNLKDKLKNFPIKRQ